MKTLILVFLPVVFLSSCTFGQKEITTVDSTSKTITTSTYEQDLSKASDRIRGSEEFKSCMDTNVPMCIQTAGMQMAQKEKSTEICEDLLSEEQKKSCKFAVTLINAQEKNDKDLCDVLDGEYQKQCRITLIRSEATQKKDPTICESIVNEESRNRDTAKDECMMNAVLADASSDAKKCDIIENEQVKSMCKSLIQSRVRQ